MTAIAPRTVESAAASATPTVASDPSIDDLDIAIRRLARQMNAESYRFRLLIRDFDDRYGFAKWSLRNCAEWLAWRCDMSFSAAREKLRTAHALRDLPAISAAFADGRLSYSNATVTRTTTVATWNCRRLIRAGVSRWPGRIPTIRSSRAISFSSVVILGCMMG